MPHMPLSSDARIEKLSKIRAGSENYGEKDILWNHGQSGSGSMELMPVFKIPLEYLIYNQRNGRILSRTLSHEANTSMIDAQSKSGNSLIQKFLFESAEAKNKKTEADIRKYGQKEVGIVTLDGIVIDGNRRLMTLNNIVATPGKDDVSNFNTFKAVILPATLQDATAEIKRLETIYQMGEDEKASYNPIEKYLQAKELFDLKWSVTDVASFMNKDIKKIETYVQTMELMDEYLENYGYDSQYTQLDKREDYFLSLNKWLQNFKGAQSARGHDGYTSMDVDLLQLVAFDYIRCYKALDGKDFRKIAEGLQASHIFGDKEIWHDFTEFHDINIFPLREQEPEINHEIEDMMNHLNDRDSQFYDNSKKLLKENFYNSIEKLKLRKTHKQPSVQINTLETITDQINIKAESFNKPETQQQLGNVAKKIEKKMMQAGSSGKLVVIKKMSSTLSDLIGSLSDEELEDGKFLDQMIIVSDLVKDLKKEAGG